MLRSERHTASAAVASAGVLTASMPLRYVGPRSTLATMRSIIATASIGYWPEADSAASITASTPS